MKSYLLSIVLAGTLLGNPAFGQNPPKDETEQSVPKDAAEQTKMLQRATSLYAQARTAAAKDSGEVYALLKRSRDIQEIVEEGILYSNPRTRLEESLAIAGWIQGYVTPKQDAKDIRTYLQDPNSPVEELARRLTRAAMGQAVATGDDASRVYARAIDRVLETGRRLTSEGFVFLMGDEDDVYVDSLVDQEPGVTPRFAYFPDDHNGKLSFVEAIKRAAKRD